VSWHNLNFKDISSRHRLLVTNTLECIFNAIKLQHNAGVVEVILMNTTDTNNDATLKLPPLSQRFVTAILRALLLHMKTVNGQPFFARSNRTKGQAYCVSWYLL
jgi:hypothetical protein